MNFVIVNYVNYVVEQTECNILITCKSVNICKSNLQAIYLQGKTNTQVSAQSTKARLKNDETIFLK